MENSDHPPSSSEIRALQDEHRRIREVQRIGLPSESEALSLCEDVIISTVQNRLITLLIHYEEYVLRCYNKREISLGVSDILDGAPIIHVRELRVLQDRLLGGRDISSRTLEDILGDVPMGKFPGLTLSICETGNISLVKVDH